MSTPPLCASSVSPLSRSIAAPLPVAKCRATTSGTRRPRLAAGTRRMVSNGAPGTVAGGAADGQPAAARLGVGGLLVGFGEDPQPASKTAHTASVTRAGRTRHVIGVVFAGRA